MRAPPTVLRRATLGLVISAMVINALLWTRWSTFRGVSGIDLDVYRRGGVALLRGASLYDVNVNGLRFTYPPFAAAIFTPLSLVPVEVSRLLSVIGSLACYVVLTALCARSARVGWPQAVLVGTAGLTLEPLFTDINLGQIDLYLILMVTLDCLIVAPRHRGWLVGLAAGIKIVPGMFVLYFALRRDWPAVRRTLFGFATSVFCGALVAPGDSWRYWSGGLLDVGRFGDGVAARADNQSLPAELIRLTGDATPPLAVLVLLSVLAVLAATLVARRLLEADRPLEAMVALGLGSVLASPVSWTHHWLWAVPLLFVAVSRRWWVTSWLLGAVFLIAPMALLPMGSFRELGHSWWQATLCASYIVCGAAMLVRLFLAPSPRTSTPVSLRQVKDLLAEGVHRRLHA